LQLFEKKIGHARAEKDNTLFMRKRGGAAEIGIVERLIEENQQLSWSKTPKREILERPAMRKAFLAD